MVVLNQKILMCLTSGIPHLHDVTSFIPAGHELRVRTVEWSSAGSCRCTGGREKATGFFRVIASSMGIVVNQQSASGI
ncbi:hypothetical protein IG631_00552 [Alternaria alternata]|nr:hypothetical protein IG631_00552 [Alternaria alternata]